MSMAVLVQKYDTTYFGRIFRRLYFKLFLRSNQAKIRYLRDAGAKIGNGCVISSIEMLGTEPWLVEIGDNVRFTGNLTRVLTHDGGIPKLYDMGVAPKRYDCFGKVKIGNNCFIGSGCIITKHVTIGDNCVIGASSIVTKSIPAGSVAAGVPAKVICSVQEYYEKNRDYFDETVGWNNYEKRKYIERNMDKYEALRKQREA